MAARQPVPLTDAEIGLLTTMLLEDVVDNEGGQSYEIVTTGEKATASGLLDKFVKLIVNR